MQYQKFIVEKKTILGRPERWLGGASTRPPRCPRLKPTPSKKAPGSSRAARQAGAGGSRRQRQRLEAMAGNLPNPSCLKISPVNPVSDSSTPCNTQNMRISARIGMGASWTVHSDSAIHDLC